MSNIETRSNGTHVLNFCAVLSEGSFPVLAECMEANVYNSTPQYMTKGYNDMCPVGMVAHACNPNTQEAKGGGL
jgi:hypothetical protein